jgi:hypothetical protein
MTLSMPILLMVIMLVVPGAAKDQLDAIRHHVRAAAMALGCRDPRITIQPDTRNPDDFEISATCAAPVPREPRP